MFRPVSSQEWTFRLGSMAFVLLVVWPLSSTPRCHPLGSTVATRNLLSSLELEWRGSGPPVVLFTRQGCPAAAHMEDLLREHRVSHLVVDVDQGPAARKAHADLGRSYLGTVATLATPTVVVGTAVIRGTRIDDVLDALEHEPWP